MLLKMVHRKSKKIGLEIVVWNYYLNVSIFDVTFGIKMLSNMTKLTSQEFQSSFMYRQIILTSLSFKYECYSDVIGIYESEITLT